jgi:hypothetical protein
MDNQDFVKESQDFITTLKNSSLYQETLSLSDQISGDPHLQDISTKRNDCYIKAATTDDEDIKHALEVQAKALNDELLKDPRVQQYLNDYNSIKGILALINDGILKDLNHD